VLDDTQKTWAGILQAQGIPYQHAKLALFRDATSSSCGAAQWNGFNAA
jgi:predicted metalloprotease